MVVLVQEQQLHHLQVPEMLEKMLPVQMHLKIVDLVVVDLVVTVLDFLATVVLE
jgi:hypothetical protein